MVSIASAVSVPPHIQPPIAQVPRPTRDILDDVPGTSAYSMPVRSVHAWLSITHPSSQLRAEGGNTAVVRHCLPRRLRVAGAVPSFGPVLAWLHATGAGCVLGVSSARHARA